jgi:hypothetical protein
MKRLLLALAIVSLPGCSWYDIWFGALGSSYSGGGTSSFEKRAEYDDAIRSYGGEP